MVFRAKYKGFDVSCDTKKDLEALEKAGGQATAGHGGRRTEPGSAAREAQSAKKKHHWTVIRSLHEALGNGGVDLFARQLTTWALYSQFTKERKRYEQLHEHRSRMGKPLSEAEIEAGTYLTLYRKYVPVGQPDPPCPPRPNFD